MTTKSFVIEHTTAGDFQQGDIVTEKQITDSGADFEFWQKVGAVKEVKTAAAEEAETDKAEAMDAEADKKATKK